MPKMPITSIDFGGEKYIVESVDNLIAEDAHTLSGRVHHGQFRIELDKTECLERQTSTLIHECIHYYLRTYGYRDKIKDDCVEGLIDTVALGFITLIKRNPNLVRLLQEQV